MLRNRTYLCEIVHKGQSHPGDHAPIIDQPLWDAAQSRLADNTAERSSGTRSRQPSLLAGILFDPDGNRMTPTHAVESATRYRYYVFHSLITKDQSELSPGLRLPAAEIEQVVTTRCASGFSTPAASTRQHGFSMRQRSAGSLREPRNRQELARVATTTPARRRYGAHRAHRRRKRPNRHAYPPEMVWRVPRWGLDTIAERDGL